MDLRFLEIVNMRLFIAINFNMDVVDKIKSVQRAIKAKANRGNFTIDESLHLTLVSLGEIAPLKIDTINKVMDSMNHMSFELRACLKSFIP